MGYQPHKMFETPCDDTIIWRYIPIEQLLGILNGNCLYFTNPRTLEDKLEGIYPNKTYWSLWNSINLLDERLPIKKCGSYEFERKIFESDSNNILNLTRKENQHLTIHINQLTQDMSNLIFCNYWTVSEKENAIHWWRYSGNPTTVAIKSTIGRLKKSFSSELNVHVGKINYINYASDHTWNYEKIIKSDFKDKNSLINLVYSLHLNKDDKYEDESEVRCILSYKDTGKHIEKLLAAKEQLGLSEKFHPYITSLTHLEEIPIFETDWGPPWILSFEDAINDLPFNLTVLNISVDLKQLIEEIIVSPKAQSYFKGTLQQTVEKYGLEKDIIQESDIP